MNTFNKNDYRSGFMERMPVHYIFLSALLLLLCKANISMAMDGVVLNIFDMKGLNTSQFSHARLTHSFEITPSTQNAPGDIIRTTYSIQQRLLSSLPQRHPTHPRVPGGSQTPHVSTLTLKTAVGKEGTPTPESTKPKKWLFSKKRTEPSQGTGNTGASEKIYTCTRPLRNPPQIFTINQTITQSLSIAFDRLPDSNYYIRVENMPNFGLTPTSLNFNLAPDSLISAWSDAEDQFGLFNVNLDGRVPRLPWSSLKAIIGKLLPLNDRWSGNLLDIVLGIDCRWEVRAILMPNPGNPEEAILLGLQLTLPDQAAGSNLSTPPTPLQNLFVQLQPLNPTEAQLLISQQLLTHTPIESEQTQSTSPVTMPPPQQLPHQPQSGPGSNHGGSASLVASIGQLSLSEQEVGATANSPQSTSSSPSVENGSGISSRRSLKSGKRGRTDYENFQPGTSISEDDYIIMHRSSEPSSSAFTTPASHSWGGTVPLQSQPLSPNIGSSPYSPTASPGGSGYPHSRSQYSASQHSPCGYSSASRSSRTRSKSASHDTSPIFIPGSVHNHAHQRLPESPNLFTTGSTPSTSQHSEGSQFRSSPFSGSPSGTHSPVSPPTHYQNSPDDEAASVSPQSHLPTIHERDGGRASHFSITKAAASTSKRSHDYANVLLSRPIRPAKPEPLSGLPLPLPNASKEEWQEYHEAKKHNEELYGQMLKAFDRDMTTYRQDLEIFMKSTKKPTHSHSPRWHDPDNDGDGASGGMMFMGEGLGGNSAFSSF